MLRRAVQYNVRAVQYNGMKNLYAYHDRKNLYAIEHELGPELVRFRIGLPTEPGAVRFRLANRNRTDLI